MGQEFTRETGNELNPIAINRQVFTEHLKLFSLRGLMGPQGSGAAICVDTELEAESGDTKKFTYIPQALETTDALKGQDVEILGNEKKVSEFPLSITVDEVNFPLRKRGKMTDQRSVVKYREVHKRQITRAFAQYNEDVIFDVLSGRTAAYKAAPTTTDAVNGAGRCIRASGSSDYAEVTAANSDETALASAMANTDLMSPQLIEAAVIMAKQSGTYKLQPLRVGPDNREFFILFVSLKAAKDLRFNQDWQDHALSVVEAGLGAEDMIATGALGVWDNVIVKKSERIYEFADGGDMLARNLLVGGDAAVLAWAQTTEMSEEILDHGRVLSSNGSEIRGEVKVTFNDVDMGVAQVITASN